MGLRLGWGDRAGGAGEWSLSVRHFDAIKWAPTGAQFVIASMIDHQLLLIDQGLNDLIAG